MRGKEMTLAKESLRKDTPDKKCWICEERIPEGDSCILSFYRGKFVTLHMDCLERLHMECVESLWGAKMTPEQYTRQLEIALKVIQVWVAGSRCYICQTVEQKCREALKEKSEK